MLAYCLLAPFEAIRCAVPQLDEVLQPNGFFAMQEAHRARQHSCLCNNDNEQRYRVAAAGTEASSDAPSTCSFCSHGATSSTVGAAGGLPPYTLGCHLLHGRRVLELGSGYGLLGLLLAHFARSVTLTDHNDEVLQLLRRNVQLAEEGRKEDSDGSAAVAAAAASSSAAGSSDGLILRRLQADLHVEKLAWGPEVDLPPFPGAENEDGDDGLPDVLIGGDIVYDGSVVPLLFSLVARCLERARPHALFLCSYKTRWLVVDREMDAALLRHGLRSLRVPLDAFMSAEKMAEKDGQRFKHGNMLIIWKPDRTAEEADSSPAAKL
jgi:predicted nicotinamide N-methyase